MTNGPTSPSLAGGAQPDGQGAPDGAPLVPPGPPPAGPPLGGMFSLAGRPASGLYAAAWILVVVGVALFGIVFAAGLSGNQGGAGLLFAAAMTALFLAASMGAGYQVVARRTLRPPERYPGPSPFLLFAVVFFGANGAGSLLALAGLVRPETSLGVLASIVIVAGFYAGSVWLFVVREGALAWREMGWAKAGRTFLRLVARLAYGGALGIPVFVATAYLGALLALALDVRPTSPLPAPTDASGAVVNVVVAVLVAPLGEELFFRGFAQTAWTRDLGWRAGLVRAALFFAVVHVLNLSAATFAEGLRLAVYAALVRFPVGLALGWVFARSGSIAPSIGMHMAFNGAALVVVEVAGRTLGS